MKEFVVGAPYTTETTLDDDDEFLIVACDGVSLQAGRSVAPELSFCLSVAVGCDRRPGGCRSD